jgi:hypothetical protein
VTASPIEPGYTYGPVFVLTASIVETAAAVAVPAARRRDTAVAARTAAPRTSSCGTWAFSKCPTRSAFNLSAYCARPRRRARRPPLCHRDRITSHKRRISGTFGRVGPKGLTTLGGWRPTGPAYAGRERLRPRQCPARVCRVQPATCPGAVPGGFNFLNNPRLKQPLRQTKTRKRGARFACSLVRAPWECPRKPGRR